MTALPRVAFVYDHLHPYTSGGAERYYAALAAELARNQPVTHLTRAYWDGEPPRRGDGVELIGLTRARPEPAGLVGRSLLKLRFARALFSHLLRHGGRYGVVHCCSFPQGALAAAALGLLPHRRTRLVGDWHEVLSRRDWRSRLCVAGGELGRLVQRLSLRAGDAAVTFSRLHAGRLTAAGRADVRVLAEFPPQGRLPERAGPEGREPLVVFAGRLVPQKRAHLLPQVVAELRRSDPSWRGVVFGEGPEAARIAAVAAERGVADGVGLAGLVPWEELSAAMLRARALLLPSMREGFGLVVLEAAAHGLPSVLTADEDNAATELVAEGENGRLCPADPAALAAAVLELAADHDVHRRARAWFDERRERFSVERAAAELRELHASLRRDRRGAAPPRLR